LILVIACLIDIKSPNPSVETFLHAFLPFKFVDHTHADAILNVTNRPGGLNFCKKVFGNKVSIVPYVMPGFILAKKINEKAFRDRGSGFVVMQYRRKNIL